jgi:hypothetical protein
MRTIYCRIYPSLTPSLVAFFKIQNGEFVKLKKPKR